MSEDQLPDHDAIVRKGMYAKDAFSQWLGIEVAEVKPGAVVLTMEVRPEMTNGFGIAHGGIAFSLADSALAFAANAHGRQAVTVQSSVSFFRPARAGDRLICFTAEEHLGPKTAMYHISITNQHQEKIAVFSGTVYRTSKSWTDEQIQKP